MSRVIGIFSGKGGVGKTTLVANLGAALTGALKKNVVIFDNNIHTSHLGLHFGLYEDLPVTLREVLKRNIPLTQATYIHPSTGIRIIPAPINGDGINLTRQQCAKMTKQVSKNYDIVLLDCAPGLGNEVLAPMSAIDDAIVISTPDVASLADAVKTIELLKRMKKNVIGVVVNRYKNQRYQLTPQEITSTTNYNIIGIIPEDDNVQSSLSKGLPVVVASPNSSASKAFKKLAASLVNEQYTEPGFFDRFRGMFDFSMPKIDMPIILQPKINIQPEPIIKREVATLKQTKNELLRDVRKEMKKELKEKIRRRLKERLYA
ncbi:MAG: P-loop NTPase [Candidatus Aenigmarchaeota archaeon]|nr:P-loop NTPase [Candidatus Aenigmarchaeota archaeon]